MSSDEDLADRVEKLERMVESLSDSTSLSDDLDIIWIIVSSVLVFFMQVGFAMVSTMRFPFER